MLCSYVGHAKIKTHHPTFLDMDCTQNGSVEVSIREAPLEWKAIKMVNHVGRIQLKVCVRKTIKGSVMLDFCVENPIEGEHGKEDFLDKET